MTIPVWFQDWYNNGSGGIAAAAQVYIDRVEADGGTVESIGCVPSAVWDWVAPSLLLDLFPNAAAAYSLRKLRAAYSGSAVRVRKEVSSVSSETDIGFLADGSLDTVSLLAFASDADSGDVFVVTWYDQSLSNDATQSTAANQPKIVSGGSLVTENGKPAVDFDGVSSSFNVSKITLSDDWNLFITHKLDSNSYYFGDTIGGDYLRYRINDSYRLQIAGGTDTVTGIGDIIGAQKLLNIERDSSNNLEYYLNGTSAATSSISGAWDIDEIGASVTNHFDGTFQELIIFNSDQSSNRTGIETNINTFYSVYP